MAKRVAIITAAILVLFTAGVVFELKELFPLSILAVTVFFMVGFLKKHFAKAVLFGMVGFALIMANSSAYGSVHEIFHPQPVEAASNFIIDGQDVPSVILHQEEEVILVSCTLNYPDQITPWCGLIEEAALKHTLDPLLIASVMMQESGGQQNVISNSGAVGLMQVMPRDGVAASFWCANGPCFSERPSIEELLDPGFNIDYASGMLSNLIKNHGNDIRNGLAAYGPYDVGYYYADLVLAIYAGL